MAQATASYRSTQPLTSIPPSDGSQSRYFEAQLMWRLHSRTESNWASLTFLKPALLFFFLLSTRSFYFEFCGYVVQIVVARAVVLPGPGTTLSRCLLGLDPAYSRTGRIYPSPVWREREKKKTLDGLVGYGIAFILQISLCKQIRKRTMHTTGGRHESAAIRAHDTRAMNNSRSH